MNNIFVWLSILLLVTACAKPSVSPANEDCNCTQVKNGQSVDTTPIQLPDMAIPDEISANIEAEEVLEIEQAAEYPLLKPATWQDLDGLLQDNLKAAWPAWLQSCSRLIKKPQWQSACNKAKGLTTPSNAQIIDYLTEHFDVHLASNEDGSDTGLITGYYQPMLKGSKKQSKKYPYPLYSQPADLVTVELATVRPELEHKRVRGKLVGNKLVPYSSRAEIETQPSPLAGSELFWIDDIIDVFFLQIQGSGVVQLENGEQIHVGYANHNGHDYRSIGRILIDRGELSRSKASMQGIKNWARKNLDKLRALLNSNPSYVFFRTLPKGLPGPIGALGVPITAQRSVAVDSKFIPLGAPIFLSTTQPNSKKVLKRLMMAQDKGGAIKGGVRADFFWGAGDKAGAKAGSMKQSGKVWVLLPKGYIVNNSTNQ